MVAKRVTIYLDNSALNRPFDDQSQARIARETEALRSILRLTFAGEIELLYSWVGRFESERSPQPDRRAWVNLVFATATHYRDLDDPIRHRGRDLERIGVKAFDALHLAAAELGGATWFITCDDRLQRRYNGPLRVVTPEQFLTQLTLEQQP